MTNEELMHSALTGRLWLAGGAIVAGLITIGLGAYLIFHKRGDGASDSRFKAGGLEFSSGTVGGLFIVSGFAWGFVAAWLAPKLKLNGNEVALNLFEKPLVQAVAVLDTGKAADSGSDLYAEFRILAEAEIGKKLRDGKTSATQIETDMVVENNHPVFSIAAESDERSVAMKYVPVNEKGNLRFVPVEIIAKSVDSHGAVLQFTCTSSIEAFIRKVENNPASADLNTHRRVLKERCASEIEGLSKEKREKILVDKQ
ncbi:MAG: hypothetical protein ACK5Y2_01515 [Bdellovibrionales bacterium]